MVPILTAKVGTSADLFQDILELYVATGALILDMTYGNGAFWKKVDKTNIYLIRNDLFRNNTEIDSRQDLRATDFPDGVFDTVILDPPYAAHGTPLKPSIETCYNGSTVEEMSSNGVMDLYFAGIREAMRILKPGGILILKTQDEIESGKQVWKHTKLLELEGFICEDLFILVQKTVPVMRHNYQKHARKNHSYFIVQRKL